MKNLKATLISLLAFVLFGGFIVYEIFSNNQGSPATLPSNNQNTISASQNKNNNSNTQNTQQTPPQNIPAPTTPAQTGYKNGQYTGNVADAFYGQMQVKAIISGGKLTDIQFLQYPNHAGHSSQISSSSLPQLKSEAIHAQNANVNIISGATQTSQAFIQSLASALSQAS